MYLSYSDLNTGQSLEIECLNLPFAKRNKNVKFANFGSMSAKSAFWARAESRFLFFTKEINFTAIFDLEKAAAGSNDHDLDPERVLSAVVGLRESAARDIV